MAGGYPGKEKRKAKRVKVGLIIFYKVNSPVEVRMMVGKADVDAIMLDLSESGMAILAGYNLPKDATITAKFVLVNENAASEEFKVRAIEIKGGVRYAAKVKEDAFRLGIQFTDMTGADLAFVREFVKMLPEA